MISLLFPGRKCIEKKQHSGNKRTWSLEWEIIILMYFVILSTRTVRVIIYLILQKKNMRHPKPHCIYGDCVYYYFIIIIILFVILWYSCLLIINGRLENSLFLHSRGGATELTVPPGGSWYQRRSLSDVLTDHFCCHLHADLLLFLR